ncbi:MAG: cobalt ECF transporter T component CbiQ [Candidatus Omnitrophica bacterium]|nr:cobalt ECF transporter T component CbiQ [Candidatus Omnitrophota bacterium]
MIRALHFRHNFLEQSLRGAVSFIKDATLCEEQAAHGGLLQSLNPILKTLVVSGFLGTSVFLQNPWPLGVVYLFCLVSAVLSQIPLGFFLLRTWVFIPFFSVCIAVPAMFSFVPPGPEVLSLHWWTFKLVITRPGLNGAILFVVRITTCVSWSVLLSLTTRHTQLLGVLRGFGLPQIFSLTVSMSYRYLYLFAQMLENILTAIKSRVGTIRQRDKGRQVIAWNIANMWNKAQQMNEQVYLAMLSRGYTGQPRGFTDNSLSAKDWVWLACSMVVCVSVILWAIPDGRPPSILF